MSAIKNAAKLKSKTINFNALYVGLIATIEALGYRLPPEAVAAGGGLLNALLRFLTKVPLGSK